MAHGVLEPMHDMILFEVGSVQTNIPRGPLSLQIVVDNFCNRSVIWQGHLLVDGGICGNIQRQTN